MEVCRSNNVSSSTIDVCGSSYASLCTIDLCGSHYIILEYSSLLEYGSIIKVVSIVAPYEALDLFMVNAYSVLEASVYIGNFYSDNYSYVWP